MRIHFLTNKLHRTVGLCVIAIALVVFLLCLSLLQPVSAQVPAATQQQTQLEDQPGSLWTLLDQVMVQLQGVVAFTAQAIGAVRPGPTDAQGDVVSTLPATRSDLATPAPIRFPLQNLGAGTFIINAPLSVRQSLMVAGMSQFATTTISGPLSAGVVDASSLTVGTSITTNSLQVDGAATLGAVTVSTDADINGALRALGGITTNGADIDLNTGSLFASNVVNEVVAGDNVTVTGTRNAPIISFEPEPFDGVLEINGERGRVEFEAGEDIEINGLEIENISDLDSVTSRGGCSGCISDGDVSNILTLSGGTINGTSIGLSSAAAAAFSTVSVGNALSTSSAFTVLSSGTSTFAGSINIESGCLAVGGVCVLVG